MNRVYIVIVDDMSASELRYYFKTTEAAERFAEELREEVLDREMVRVVSLELLV